MIDKKYIERCSAMLGDERAMSYLCLILTSDDQTGVDFTATVKEMAVMLANAAINRFEFFAAINVAIKLLEEHFSGQMPVEIIKMGGVNE